jgi:hypothetical protein
MPAHNYEFITNWREEDLLQLPGEETDVYEYKSSLTSNKELKLKISVAASAFWNSGGGIFIAGVDGHGKVDGGFPGHIGHQSIRDWADQVLAATVPAGPYSIKPVPLSTTPSAPGPSNVVLVIGFGESTALPHMASDLKYYIRAGAHSLPAGHFIVEALRARRGLEQPLLRGVFQRSERKWSVIDLAIVAVTEAVALNVSITFDPFPPFFTKHYARLFPRRDPFPLRVPVIDRQHPFLMELVSSSSGNEFIGDEPIGLVLQYTDVAGRIFTEHQELDFFRNFEPLQIGDPDAKKIKEAIDGVSKRLFSIENVLTKLNSTDDPPKVPLKEKP